jgi:succinoglycan biosynthesis transport protein ExoP
MAEERPVAVNRMAGRTVMRPPVAAGLTPKEVFGILRRHVLLIVVLTGLGLMIGGSTWYLLKQYFPQYTASTYIEVLPPVETDPMTISSVQVQKDIQYGHRLSMASLIKQQSTLQQLLGRDKVRQTSWFARKADEAKRIKDLDKYLGAIAHRDAGYVEVSMSCRKPGEAALIVNEMVDLFVASQGGTRRAEIAESLTKLEDQRARVQRELDAAERGLGEVRTAWGITDLELPAGRFFRHTVELVLDDLSVKENELALTIKQVQANIENLEELATGPVTEQIEHIIENDVVMLALARELAFIEAQLAGRLTKFGENHRTVLQTQELINEIREKRRLRKQEIAEQTRRANLADGQDILIVMQERLAAMEKMRAETAAKKRDLDLARVQYDQRLKIRDERTMMIDSIKEQIEKLKIIHDDPRTPKVQRVGLAPVPLEMVSSRKWWVHFPVGTILGFLFGVGFSFLIEVLNDLLRTPRDVGKYLHIPLLSMIPDTSEDDQVRGVDPYHIVHKAPYSLISESYRQLRTRLKLSSPADSKVLLVSSGSAGDGKTSVAVNLAATCVGDSKKVLLIDANFRRPSLQSLFPKVSLEAEGFDFGLSSALMRQCKVQDAIRPSGIDGLDIIDSGPLPSNPADLLDSAQMEELLKEQRENYDYIIIDSPPVLLVSDSKVLAKLADTTVLVFNATATRRGAAQRTIAQLRETGARIAGCVLIAAKAMKGGYFDEQFRSYHEYQKVQPAYTAA